MCLIKSTLAKFIDTGGEVFSKLRSMYQSTSGLKYPPGRVYCGIDLAKQEDYTVATFMDADGKVIEIYRANAQEWSTMTRRHLTVN